MPTVTLEDGTVVSSQALWKPTRQWMEQYLKREVEMAVANIRSHGINFIATSLHSTETVTKARAIYHASGQHVPTHKVDDSLRIRALEAAE